MGYIPAQQVHVSGGNGYGLMVLRNVECNVEGNGVELGARLAEVEKMQIACFTFEVMEEFARTLGIEVVGGVNANDIRLRQEADFILEERCLIVDGQGLAGR